MNAALIVAGVLALVCGASHSYLGERMILMPLFRDGRAPTSPLGDRASTNLTLRFTWHFFTVVAWSTASLFLVLSGGAIDGGSQTAIRIIAAGWAVFAVVVLAMSRGRHFAWLLGSGIAVAAWWGAV